MFPSGLLLPLPPGPSPIAKTPYPFPEAKKILAEVGPARKDPEPII